MIKEWTTWKVIKGRGGGGAGGEKNKIKLQGKCPPKKYMQSKTQGVGGDVPSAWTRDVTLQLVNAAEFLAPTFLKQIIKTSEIFWE